MIVLFPIVACEGSNVPAAGSVIPFPDHVPPETEAESVTVPLLAQNGPDGLIVDCTPGSTVTEVVAEAEQPLLVITTV